MGARASNIVTNFATSMPVVKGNAWQAHGKKFLGFGSIEFRP